MSERKKEQKLKTDRQQ